MIKIALDIFNREFEYLPMGKVKGRNYLKNIGFEECQNRDYMKSNNRYFHYNSIKGFWIGEMPVYTNDNRVLTA
jgi:hypothetical protein